MSNKPIDSIGNSLRNDYRNLWCSFQLLQYSDYKLQPTQFLPNVDRIEEGLYSVYTDNFEPLRLWSFPWRFNQPKRLDISIELDQVIRHNPQAGEDPFLVEESSITVNYYKPDESLSRYGTDSRRELLNVIRYESHSKKKSHPLFHGHSNKFDQLRIATPPMDLTAVLIGLVADHLSGKLGHLFENTEWNNTCNDMPVMPCKIIRDKIREDRLFNRHWYTI